MTSSTDVRARSSLLSDLVSALDPDRLTLQLLRPIQWAMQTFSCSKAEPPSPDQFLGIAGSFLGHLYRQGRHVPMRLSEREARAMALELLEQVYQGSLASGYVGALLEATTLQAAGLEAVLLALAEILARREMGRLAAGALVRLVNPADWRRQRQLVEELVSHLGPSFPQHLADRPLDSLVPAYRELLALFRDAQGFLASPGRATGIAGPFPPPYG